MTEGFCRTCGQSSTNHSDLYCRAQQDAYTQENAKANPALNQSAYERAQTELTARIAALTLSTETNEKRLDAALRRIEALELEVARLKGPQRDCEGRLRWDDIARDRLGIDANGSPLPDEGT